MHTTLKKAIPNRCMPLARGAYYTLYPSRERQPPDYEGFGLAMWDKLMPWGGHSPDPIAARFEDSHEELKKRYNEGGFQLTQYQTLDEGRHLIESDKWRQYIVYWSAVQAVANSASQNPNFVECGVRNGISAFFALSAANQTAVNWTGYLYDAWEGMREKELSESELGNIGKGEKQSESITQANLIEYSDHTVFNKGFIPESFDKSRNPSEVSWLHIDLNSSMPTKATLEFFSDRLLQGGVILFDDYGWKNYHETREAINQFARSPHTGGRLLSLPTGQAIYFNDELV